MTTRESLAVLQAEIVSCRQCERLVAHREAIGQLRRRAYRDQEYWAKPVPAFGDPNARVLIVGLAPGAHGANRTGRMFTGDRSGDFLYRALYETGFANQPTSAAASDGLVLRDAYITAPVHCVPPDNKPTTSEILNCRPFLLRESYLMPQVKVVVVLGRIAFDAYVAVLRAQGRDVVKSRMPFGHGLEYELGPNGPRLLMSYHPSQQNTSTGRLTAAMLRDVFARARNILVVQQHAEGF